MLETDVLRYIYFHAANILVSLRDIFLFLHYLYILLLHTSMHSDYLGWTGKDGSRPPPWYHYY